MGHWQQQAVCREGMLLMLCFCSDLFPRTLLSGFLGSHGAAWGAIADNMAHASIAAASWAVVVTLSNPPSPIASSFRLMALPGSPLHRCGVSCAPRRRTKAPPTPIPRTPSAGNTTSAEGSWEDFDAVQPCRRARPEAEEEKGGSAARSDEAGGRGASASGFVEVVFAACVGSALDLDHFVAAGSLRLSRATGLAERPWGHCVAALVVAALAVAGLTRNARAAASVFSAGLSHQLRDATRRGLWLYPPRGPTTRPLVYPAYLLAQAVLPLVVALSLRVAFFSRCGSWVRGNLRSLRRRRWRRLCGRSRSRGRGEDGDRSALLLL